MAANNILNVILKTIGEVQKRNKANPREETADPNVFDLLKGKLKTLDEKSRQKRSSRGKSPHSILDLIKKEIEGARRENKRDPKQKTAPSSVFDNILRRVDEGPRRQASAGVRKIIQDYQLDVSRVPQDVFRQVQDKYAADRKNFDQQYAKAIHDLTKRY
ncbi:MAG: hypothetical protein OEQ53_17945 [Saprospiraceae bacterium]|nr:hypothetical protein [Saprospiraceae bacterium]